MTAMLAMIGTTLGIERRMEPRERGAEPTQHVFQYVVISDAQAVADHLHLSVAIADVPGDARQFWRGGGGNLDQVLRLTIYAHDSAVLQEQPVAIAQRGRVREVKQELGAVLAGQHHSPQVTLGSIENDVVNSCCVAPISDGHDGPSVFHSDVVSMPYRRDHQNKKYLCAIGSTVAGSQVRSSPSALTS
jgi:hypothetical protein